MTDLTFRLTLAGPAGSDMTPSDRPFIDLDMPDMFMGYNRIYPEPGKSPGSYAGTGVIVRLPQRDSHLEGRGDGAGCWGGDVCFRCPLLTCPWPSFFFLSTGFAVGFGHCIGMCAGPSSSPSASNHRRERPAAASSSLQCGTNRHLCRSRGNRGCLRVFHGSGGPRHGGTKGGHDRDGASDHHDRHGHGRMAPGGADFCERFPGQRVDHPGVQTAEPGRSSAPPPVSPWAFFWASCPAGRSIPPFWRLPGSPWPAHPPPPGFSRGPRLWPPSGWEPFRR